MLGVEDPVIFFHSFLFPILQATIARTSFLGGKDSVRAIQQENERVLGWILANLTVCCHLKLRVPEPVRSLDACRKRGHSLLGVGVHPSVCWSSVSQRRKNRMNI